MFADPQNHRQVAPRAGAWIETSSTIQACLNVKSRPVRARGLKPAKSFSSKVYIVAPRAGAWIETLALKDISFLFSRAPCGRVD